MDIPTSIQNEYKLIFVKLESFFLRLGGIEFKLKEKEKKFWFCEY